MTAASDDTDLIRDGAARFATQYQHFGLLGRVATDRAGWLKAMAEGGWPGLRVSEEMGGAGLPTLALAVAAEEFGRKLLPSLAPFAAALSALGEDTPIRADLAARAAAGEAFVAPLLLDDPKALATAATANGAVILDGHFPGVADGDLAEGFVVVAREGDGPILLYVPRDHAGVSVAAHTSIDGTQLARVVFAGVSLDRRHVLASGTAAMAALDELGLPLQAGLAAELVGVAAEALDRTLAYMRARKQFGRSLGAFQALQHRAVDMACDLELSRSYVIEAARAADDPRPGAREFIAGARARAGDTALAIVKWAVQMHGAIGFTEEFDIGLFVKRAMTLTRLYGEMDVHRRRMSDATSRETPVNLFALSRQDSPEDAAFRREVRAYYEASLPARLRDLPTRPRMEDALWWHRKLHERGWIAPNWPRAHGGMEASVNQRMILFEEGARVAAPELSSQAIYHIGPIILRYGTPEQKARHLPPMLDGSVSWCQGYSEPNSGSDLASLRTRAEIRDDHFIVNGQKIWTTGAHHAQWIFALVRTDPDAADRRQGISMILIDMASKGVRPRPIRTIAGDDEFAEVFFDDLVVPKENLLGELHGGWKLANAVLENERLMTSTPQRIIALMDRVDLLSRHTGAIDDPAFRDRLARARIDALAYNAAFARQLERIRVEGSPGQAVSLLKIINTDLQQRLADLLLEAAGPDGANVGPIHVKGRDIHVATTFLQTRRATIYGGASEIQRNIVARRILDLGNDRKA